MPSIAFFKRGFGCDLVPYYAVVGYKSRWVKPAFGVHRGLRGDPKTVSALGHMLGLGAVDKNESYEATDSCCTT